MNSEFLFWFWVVIFGALGPGDKGSRPAAGTEETESQEDTEAKPSSSLLRRASPRAAAVSSLMTLRRR